jgi:hypothetical protein
LSIVICSIGSRKFQQISDNYLRLYAGQPIEIIGIHNARSRAKGYKRRAAALARERFGLGTVENAENVYH